MFGHIKFREDITLSDALIVVQIADSFISISGKPGKWFTNIPMQSDERIILIKGNPCSVSIEVSDKKQYHPDQLVFDAKHSIVAHSLEGEAVYYSLSGNTFNPKKILITFPGVSNFDNINYRLSALTSLQDRLSKHTLILAFQDRESVYGNYMYATSSGYRIKSIVISLIEGLRAKYALGESDLIFYGNSKGGTVALDYVDDYSSSYFYIDIPQIKLYEYQSQNELMRFSLGVKARVHYDFTDYLPFLSNRRVNYSYAENDDDASFGIKGKQVRGVHVNMLKDFGHSGAAMELVKRQFTSIFRLVNGDGIIFRPPISASLTVKNGMIYFNRKLKLFKTLDSIKALYVEINFVSEDNIYSISLSRKLDEDCCMVFWDGLRISSHLPTDRYCLYLSVYSGFRQFVYPLNKILHFGDDIYFVDGDCPVDFLSLID